MFEFLKSCFVFNLCFVLIKLFRVLITTRILNFFILFIFVYVVFNYYRVIVVSCFNFVFTYRAFYFVFLLAYFIFDIIFVMGPSPKY